MEEIKQLLDEAKRNLYDKDFVELHINLEAALNKVSNIVYGAENEEAEEKIVKNTIQEIEKVSEKFEEILMEAFLSDEERQAILEMMEKHDNLVEDLKSGNARVTIKRGIKYE